MSGRRARRDDRRERPGVRARGRPGLTSIATASGLALLLGLTSPGTGTAADADTSATPLDHRVVAHLTDGSRIVGTVQSMDSTQVVLDTEFGPVTVPAEQLAWMDFGRAGDQPDMAGDPPPTIGASRDRAWAGISVRVAEYSMEDVNVEIRTATFGGSSVIDGGINVAGELGFQITPTLAVAAQYDRFLAGFEHDNPRIHYDLPADVYYGSIRVRSDPRRFPVLEGQVGVGVVKLDGEIKESGRPEVPTGPVEGSGGMLQLLLAVDLGREGSSTFRVVPHLGYRLAEVADTTIGGQSVNFRVDYSGWIVGVTLKLALERGGEPAP